MKYVISSLAGLDVEPSKGMGRATVGTYVERLTEKL